jgi:hypothetical protein
MAKPRRPAVPERRPPAPPRTAALHGAASGQRPPPDPPPPPPPPSPEERAAAQADLLRDGYVPAALASVVQLPALIETAGCHRHLARLLADAGAAADPVERMLVEQLALTHFTVARLHAHAGDAPTADDAGLYLDAAARLQGEFRRSALALQVYRLGAARRADETKAEAGAAKVEEGGTGGSKAAKGAKAARLRLAETG